MSGRGGSHDMIEREGSPHARREDSPKNKGKSYSRSPSRSKKMSYREDNMERESRRERRSDRDRGDREYRRERTRSRSRSDRHHKRYSRSGSRSPGGGEYGRRRSHSHSPMSSRRRHLGTRDNPKQSRCLGVFGLSVYTTEDELYDIFRKYGPVERVQVVIDAKTGRSRGFAFVYFENGEDAKISKDNCTGMKIHGKSIRVDYSITERAHTPTPGIYMGKPTYKYSERYDRRRDRDDYRGSRYRRRSPSPYYRSRSRRYERSRSRSYSPRHF